MTANTKTVTFKINRGETMQGSFAGRVEEFEVVYDNSTTILQALEDIKAQQDGSLTFRRSCRASICGSCGMVINNRSRLACKTKVREIVDGNAEKNLPPASVIELSPQSNQPVIKDLAVDIANFYKKIDQITPYVQEGKEANKNVDKSSFEQVNMVSNCIMCGCCYSDCTELAADSEFLGPAALAKAFRFVADPREGHKTERLQELSEKHGIWDCTRCGMCVDACPKDVAPMEAIAKLRVRAIEAGIVNNRGAKHAIAFKGDIGNSGMLNEPIMLLKTVGIMGIIKQLGNAIHLAKKGKIPSFFPHKVENVNEVQDIYKELAMNPVDVETKQEDTGPGAG
ncbi:MAG: succinate dehydrogenase / fumarate reductase iron-sulfur subunit [Alphaproteobacteria bacterium]|jgi:succinate dehydrogenase / fumarate reductase iron-sulfur subunit